MLYFVQFADGSNISELEKTDPADEHKPCRLIIVRNEPTFLWDNKVIEEIPYLSVSTIYSLLDLSRG